MGSSETLPAFSTDALAGRHVLVTGASSGLGRAAAELLATCGARLSLVGRDQAQLDLTLSQLAGAGHSAHIVALDDAEVAADAVQALAKDRGAFHGIFYSAGSTMVLPIKLLKNKHLNEAFGAGLWGVFGTLRAAAKKGVMVDGGSIVIMSSVAAMRGRPALSAYCAAKAGVDALVRCAALEFADRKIRVNSIRAAAVETAMHHQFFASIGEEAAKDYTDRHPLGFGQPEDVANQVVYLLSDASSWVSGTNIPVDGAAAVK